MAESRRPREIPGQHGNLFRRQVDQEPFRYDESVARAAESLEEAPPRRRVGQVESDPLESTTGLLAGESFLLVREEIGKVDFDPPESRGQVHAIRSRVEARREVHDRVGALRDALPDEPVEEIRPRDPRPRVAGRQRLGDPQTARSREPAGEGIAEERVRPVVFPRAVGRGPERRVRDVSDERVRRHTARSVSSSSRIPGTRDRPRRRAAPRRASG